MPFFSFKRLALIGAAIFATLQSGWAQTPAQPAPADPTNFIFLMVAMVAIMYIIVIRPQQREQKRHQERINSLKKGDRVVTAGGIHGSVKTVRDKTLVVEIAPGVKITLNRQSISSVLEGENGKGRKDEEQDDGDEGEEAAEGKS